MVNIDNNNINDNDNSDNINNNNKIRSSIADLQAVFVALQVCN